MLSFLERCLLRYLAILIWKLIIFCDEKVSENWSDWDNKMVKKKNSQQGWGCSWVLESLPVCAVQDYGKPSMMNYIFAHAFSQDEVFFPSVLVNFLLLW